MVKPYLNYSDQINLLSQGKELLISDTHYALQMLTDIGYFSLIGGYKTPFINPMTRKYEASTTFEDRATVSHIMGHTEEVDANHYDYDTAQLADKQQTMDKLYA